MPTYKFNQMCTVRNHAAITAISPHPPSTLAPTNSYLISRIKNSLNDVERSVAIPKAIWGRTERMKRKEEKNEGNDQV